MIKSCLTAHFLDKRPPTTTATTTEGNIEKPAGSTSRSEKRVWRAETASGRSSSSEGVRLIVSTLLS